jgi:hypothetical protein
LLESGGLIADYARFHRRLLTRVEKDGLTADYADYTDYF